MPRDRVQDLPCVVEPPRDGEFFFDDAFSTDDGPAVRPGDQFIGFVMRFPLRIVTAAVIFGAVLSGVVFQVI